jgi:DNA-binding transcriptional ArsR family regulator
MIELKLSVESLGRTRFGYSPLAELASSIRALAAPSANQFVRPWLQHVHTSLQRVNTQLLHAVVPSGPIVPNFMYPWSVDPKVTIEHQLANVAEHSMHRLWEDLERVWSKRHMPDTLDQLRHRNAGEHLAEVLSDYWSIAIEPYWARIRAVIEDDVSYRANRILSGGLFDLFVDLTPEITLDDRTIRIDKPHHTATYVDTEVTLVPSVFVGPCVVCGQGSHGRYDILFPAREVSRVWEGLQGSTHADPRDDVIGALIGRTRSLILSRLALPMTTTQLASDLDQSPGAVNAHLSILRANGLLTSWRSGRNVFYRQTPLATSIIDACKVERSSEQPA